MKYLICQDWFNTSNNHAGMRYLCQYLEIKYPKEYATIIITQPKGNYGKNRLINKIKYLRIKYLLKKKNIQAAQNLLPLLQSSDKIFLMEYLDPGVNQYIIARIIRKKFPNITIYGMSHLVPPKIEKLFSNNQFQKWIKEINRVITLGNSLSNYFISRGVPEEKIVTTFHYIDQFYLLPQVQKHNEFTIIAMGSQMRNIELLSQIVKCNQNVKFIICQGNNNLKEKFPGSNVILVPFVPEEELRELMQQADVSLNVMYDTIGSNVIVTSMGMGLAMICSNVGSIKDYCDKTNTFFCNNLEDFNQAIQQLRNNPSVLLSMKESSRVKALKFSINNFHTDINNKL